MNIVLHLLKSWPGVSLLVRALVVLMIVLAASSCRLLVDRDRERVVQMMLASDGSPPDRQRIAAEVRKLKNMRVMRQHSALLCVLNTPRPLSACAVMVDDNAAGMVTGN